MIIMLELHTFPCEQIIFLSMTLFKLVASSSEEKVADFSEQCSRRVSSVVGAYYNPSVMNYFRLSILYGKKEMTSKHLKLCSDTTCRAILAPLEF